MYLLDTNHCSRIIFGDPDLQQRLQSHLNDGAATSVIVRGELLYMVQKSNQQTVNLKAVRALLQIISLYPINGAVADVYGILKGNIVNQLGPKDKTQRRKITIQALGFGENDLWITATALHYNLTIVSADTDFARIQQVQPFPLESWL